MKIQNLYKLFLVALCLCLAVTACQHEGEPLLPISEGEGTLNLSFNLVPTDVSRSVGGDGVINLYYEAKDGQIVPCEAPEQPALTRAGDGNAVDGGGMKDLAVFLVDANDNIVGRKSFPNLEDVTTQTISFFGLTSGTYTVYAYANTIGNDWFDIPSANETSFANYKEALLKPLENGLPTLNSDRMPLTGKQNVTVGSGSQSCTIQMLRPVGKLSVTVTNNKSADAVDVETPDFGDFIPRTGYVFKQNGILPKDATINPYHSFDDNEKYAVIPNASHLVYESFLYETTIEGGIKFSMSYNGADYTFQENLSGNLQHIDNTDLFLVKDASEDLYLRMSGDGSSGYKLEYVTSFDLDESCFWKLSSSGGNGRSFTNNNGVSITLNEEGITFTNSEEKLHYYPNSNSIQIGDGSYRLKYFPSTENTNGYFGVATDGNGTNFQFFSYVPGSGGGEISSEPIRIDDLVNETDTKVILTTILRNQHINLNILFKDIETN